MPPLRSLQVEGLADRKDQCFFVLADRVVIGYQQAHTEIDFGGGKVIAELQVVAFELILESAVLRPEVVMCERCGIELVVELLWRSVVFTDGRVDR